MLVEVLMSPVVENLVIVVLSLAVFLIAREMMCWYFKLNRIVELLERIAKK